MRRDYRIPADPYVEARIRELLAATVEDPPALDLPKPKPLLARWKIAAAAAQSPANRNAKIERRWFSPLKPRQQERLADFREDR